MTEPRFHGLIGAQDLPDRNAETPAVSDDELWPISLLEDEALQFTNDPVTKLQVNARGPELRKRRDRRHRLWEVAGRIEPEWQMEHRAAFGRVPAKRNLLAALIGSVGERGHFLWDVHPKTAQCSGELEAICESLLPYG
jgi:hypothetical protein